MTLQVEMKVTPSSKSLTPDSDMNWIVKNLKKLQVDYPEKWIAVKDAKVVETDTDLESLLGKLKKNYGNILGFAVEFIGAKPRNLLL